MIVNNNILNKKSYTAKKLEDKKKLTTSKIVCPFCGMEYSADEIFFPGELIGKSETIIRDPLNHIIYRDYEEGNEPDQTEHYICDSCGKAFKVIAITTYRAEAEDEDKDFTIDYVNLLN